MWNVKKRGRLTFCVLLLLVAGFSSRVQSQARRTERLNGRDVAAGEVLVKFRGPTAAAPLDDIQQQTDAGSIEPVGRTGVRLLRSRSLGAAALVARLTNHPAVLYAEPNYIVHAFTEPNDPSFPQLWGLKNVGQAVNGGLPGIAGADIHATRAWDVTVGSTVQVVAVVDTGIDYTHPDLSANIWSAPAPFTVTIGGTPITCPAGSHGFNAIAMTCDPMDDHGHGTHVAGTIGASGDNGVGVVGVNWIARVMAVKFLDASGSGTEADAINGIDFAIQAKQTFGAAANVRVLSNSWGGTDFSQALQDEIRAANDADMLFVAAAGNNGISNDILPTYPASDDSPNIVAVAATDDTDTLAWFSNYSATSVHLGAPGVDVLSTFPGGQYEFLSGTSMATPHVSGAAALVLSRCTLDTAALKDTLLSTVEPVPALAAVTVTGGRLDVNSAVRSCIAPPDAPTELTALAGDGQVTLQWSGAAGALAFTVKRSLTAGGPYAPIASGVKGKKYVDTGVVNGTTYSYVVSATNTLGDSADSNEASATPKTPSDLVISSLTVPSTAGAGSPLAVTVVTKNQGPGASSPTTTKFYLSHSPSIDASAALLDGAQAVPALAPGATATASATLDIPNVAPSYYYVIAKADADDVESETQESNNTLGHVVTIGPDLTASLSGPSSAAPGGTIVVSDVVKNAGGGPAGATTTRFYLSVNAAIDASDVPLSESRAVPALAAGASSAGSTTLTIPSTVATGSYYLLAKADADNVVAETQELNNTAAKTLQVGGDLVVSALTVPFKAGAGSTLVIADTTTNQGAAAVGASTTRFYLSNGVTIDPSAIQLPEARAVPELAAGAGSSGSTTVTIPSTVATGNYFLVAKADADGAVAETQEANNIAARAMAVGGDLVISALTVPATATAGASIAISDTTTNQGGGAVAASTTRFFLSTNAVLDAGDVLLPGARAVPPLASGAASSGSTTVMLPSSLTAGTYYIIAKADADGVVAETQEGNNSSARSTSIGGDLIVSAFTVPATGGGGAVIVVSDTTKNQGSNAVVATTTRFYLSTNVTLDASDTLLNGGRSVPALDAGASSSGSTTLTLPLNLGVATYYVIAVADADGVAAESVETNNTIARAIAIGPDLAVTSLSLPFSIRAGSAVAVADTVRNAGGDAAAASTTRFYLSTDVFLDAGDAQLPAGRAVPALAAGASSAGTTTVTIPAGTAPGFYYVIAVADGDHVVTESQENNNSAVRAIQISSSS